MVALLAATLLPALPAAVSSATVLHAPIVIVGDAQFTFANGVVAGSGTAADPYVIEGWRIEPTTGSAIAIRATTQHVVVRGNVLGGGAGAVAVDLRDNTGTVRVADNAIDHKGFGVAALGGTTFVEGNAIRDVGSAAFFGAAVSVRAGDAWVANNTLTANDRAALLTSADVDAWSNVVVSGSEGFHVNGGVAVLGSNEVLSTGRAVYADGAARVDVVGGLFARPSIGVHARQSVVAVDALTVEGATGAAMLLEDGSATVTDVEVVGGATGVEVVRGRADLSGGAWTGVQGVATRFVDATGSASGGTYLQNGGGVALDGASVATVAGNVMTSNVWGLGIAYASAPSIPLLGVNTVNGVDASQSYHWREANVAFAGTLDSGYGAGLYGSLTREGLLVLYDVDGAFVTGASLSHGTVGVHAVNSFNVVVESSVLLSNVCGVVFNGTVGFVKNSTIDIPVDPPTTCGVHVQGGFAGVLNNTVRRVDVGIVVEGDAKANVSGNLVTETFVGVRVVAGSPRNVTVGFNTLAGNAVGLELQARADADVRNNTIRHNTWAGVRVTGSTSATFTGNVVVRNLRGVEDLTPCATATALGARSRLESNVFANNTEFGVALNGTVVARGNAFVDNGDDGANVCGRVEGRFNVYARNGGDGLEVRGSADLDRETTVHNEFGAGFRFTGTLFVVLRSEVRANFDGVVGREPLPLPPVPPVNPGTPQVPRLPTLPCLCSNPDPIWIHLSRISANTRFAVAASPQTDVNATDNWWGSPDGPNLWIPQFAEFGNTVQPHVRFVPWFADAAMTDREPV